MLHKIKRLLQERKLTQKSLTDFLGLGFQTFTDWNTGKSKSYERYLPQIAAFFGMSVDSLLSDTPEIKSGVALTENEQKLLDTFRLLDGDSQIIALANLIKFARSASTAGGKTEEFGSDSNTSVPVLAGMDMASVRGV